MIISVKTQAELDSALRVVGAIIHYREKERKI